MGIIYTNSVSAEEYAMLRASAGWSEIHPEQAQASLAGSALVAAARDGERAVGMARLVWDGGYSALIKDVLVLPEYQGQGVGAALMTELLDFLRSRLKPGYMFQVDLMAAKGKEGFYEKLGFVRRPRENRGAGMDLWMK